MRNGQRRFEIDSADGLAKREGEVLRMSLFEIFLLGVGLSMDAFAVSICKGMAVRDVTPGNMCTAGIWFGGFQMLMPLIGFFAGSLFYRYIERVDHWIAFLLLGLIGANMIRESFSKEEPDTDRSFHPASMFVMAVATSIDALVVGLTLAFLNVNIWLAVTIIGITTFVISAGGVKIGSVFGLLFKSKAEILGGIILILIGTRILLEHLGVIA